MSKLLIILVGNIGTGKTRFCLSKFTNGEISIRPDEINLPIEELYNLVYKIIEKGLNEKNTVVIDGNNLTKNGRYWFLRFAKEAKCKSMIYDFGPGDDITLNRRINSSNEESREFWTRIHKKNQKEYEKPLINEGFDEIITKY